MMVNSLVFVFSVLQNPLSLLVAAPIWCSCYFVQLLLNSMHPSCILPCFLRIRSSMAPVNLLQLLALPINIRLHLDLSIIHLPLLRLLQLPICQSMRVWLRSLFVNRCKCSLLCKYSVPVILNYFPSSSMISPFWMSVCAYCICRHPIWTSSVVSKICFWGFFNVDVLSILFSASVVSITSVITTLLGTTSFEPRYALVFRILVWLLDAFLEVLALYFVIFPHPLWGQLQFGQKENDCYRISAHIKTMAL